MRAAVPNYVGANFNDCPPGHCFGLYFPVWKDDWTLEKDRKSEALKQTLPLPPHAQETLKSLRARQTILLDAVPEGARLSIEARSTAPFATGLGMEHPLENGFAFLNPYGLAYLPGSSIKGVLRRAAEELLPSPAGGRGAGGEGVCWTKEAITALFGLESEDRLKEHLRGALSFWDALPKPANNSMGMEVMTPHYGDYYQAKRTDIYRDGVIPHDAGQPNPIVFLVVPAESEFSFHFTCDTRRLPENLAATWQDLMHQALTFAFDWLGFGAKTAVGYGAMRELATQEKAQLEADALRCAWVDEAISRLVEQDRAKPNDVLRGRHLSEAWQALPDLALKAKALSDIRARWEKEDWWNSPPGAASKKAKAIYEGQG